MNEDDLTELSSWIVKAACAVSRLSALETENAELRAALKPFADCADEIDYEDATRRFYNEEAEPTPDEEWVKFRLLAKDYRAARTALKGSE